MPGCEPGGRGSTPLGYPRCFAPRESGLHECAPGWAGSLQNCLTGFDSSRSCWLRSAACVPAGGSSHCFRACWSRQLPFSHRPSRREGPTLSRWCSGLHGTLRRSEPWFKSRSGFSILTRPRGVPDPHATVRRSKTRFNSWRGRSTLVPATKRSISPGLRH